MFGSLSANLYRPLRMTSSRHRPWQIAAAAATGVGCGTLLTESPLGAFGLACLFFLPVHLPVAIAATLLTAGLLWSFEPALGQIGGWALEQPSVLSALREVHQFPLVPWLRLNNTVVFGGLMFAALQFIPMFIVVRRVVCIWAEAFHNTAEWIRVDGAQQHELAANVGFAYEELESADELSGTEDESFEDDLEYLPSYAEEVEVDEPATVDVEFEAPIQFIPIDDDSPVHDENFAIDNVPSLRDLPLKEAENPTEIAALLQGNEASESQPIESKSSSSFEEDIAEWVTEVVEEGAPDASSPQESLVDEAETATAAAVSQSFDELAGSAGTELQTESDPLEEAAAKVEASLGRDPTELGAEGVVQRASELAELVDEMLEVIRGEEAVDASSSGTDAAVTPGTGPTSIASAERQRLDPSLPLNSDLAASHHSADASHLGPAGPHLNEGKSPTRPTIMANAGLDASAVATSGEVGSRAVTFEEVAQHEEALRYLLHHLKEIKNLSGKVEE